VFLKTTMNNSQIRFLWIFVTNLWRPFVLCEPFDGSTNSSAGPRMVPWSLRGPAGHPLEDVGMYAFANTINFGCALSI
jgi:hypothetical protein